MRSIAYGMVIAGLLLGSLAAIISVKGFGDFFAGASLFAMLLAGGLELCKLTAAAGLHLHWDRITGPIRAYLLLAVVLLSIITSLGLFGALTSAQAENTHKVAQLESAIERHSAAITRAEAKREELLDERTGLDRSIEVMLDYDRASKAESTRQLQADQRALIARGMASVDEELTGLYADLDKARMQLGALGAKQGALVELAGLLSREDHDSASVTRWFVLLLVFVTDPVAIALLVSGLGILAISQRDITQIDVPTPETAQRNQVAELPPTPQQVEIAVQAVVPEEVLKHSPRVHECIEETSEEGFDDTLESSSIEEAVAEDVQQGPDADSIAPEDLFEDGLPSVVNAFRKYLEDKGDDVVITCSRGRRLLPKPARRLQQFLKDRQVELAVDHELLLKLLDIDGKAPRSLRVDGRSIHAIEIDRPNLHYARIQ